jgi:HPt (histidine-containing phosphotransfer) domain-containing protein
VARPEDPTRLPEKLAGLDLTAGLRCVAGNRRLYRTLLGDFLRANRTIDEEIKKSLADGQRDRTQHLVHTLKGVAGNIGAMEVHETARLLELALREEPEQISPLCQRLEQALAVVIAGLAQLAEEPVGARTDALPVAAGDLPRLAGKLTEIAGFLRMNDTAAETAFAEIREALHHLRPAATSAFEEKLLVYNFKEALQALDSLRQSLGIDPETP